MMPTLIERLEQASESSRELDAWIFCAVGHPDKKPERNFFYKSREEWGVFVTNAPKPGITFHDAPHYTTSIDAALTLVPSDCHWSVSWPVGQAELVNGKGDLFTASGGTAALALCIAALKATALTSSAATRR